jgi:phenylpropionate dioxygenase-like ring-hydroxylating dioxygenase large terminal subunit
MSADPIAALRASAARPFTRARAMPPAIYTSGAVAAVEIERIFSRDWICVGRAETLKRPGDYLTYDLAGQPVVVLRDTAGDVRAMSNVCLHRMSTLLAGSGRRKVITCPYHAWTYELDGRLRHAPYMDRNECFRREDLRLPQIRSEIWQGWLFITLNPDAEPVAGRLAGLAAAIAPFGMATYSELFREEHVWNTNWKVLAENFMESYHLPACHAATIGGLSRIDAGDLPAGAPAYNIHFITKDPSFTLSVAHRSNTTLAGDWRLTTAVFAVYPALMITLTPGYFWYLSLHPRGPDRVYIVFGGGLSPDFVNDPEAPAHFEALKKLLDEVNEEDRGCTERVFRGLSSRLAAPGPMSHLERPLYDFSRYLADRLG